MSQSPNHNTNQGPPEAKASIPSKSDESWLEHAQKEMQNEPARMEDAAKFLVAIISISLSLFLTKRPAGLAEYPILYAIAGVLWIGAALFSFWVLFPFKYDFDAESPQRIREQYREIAQHKRLLLMISIAFFMGALGMAIGAFLLGA